MKRWFYSLMMIALGAFTACTPELLDLQLSREPSGQEATGKVRISFQMEIPTDGPATKAMAEKPQIQNMYVAVFGGSGYFNEWVPVTLEADDKAVENSIVYNLKMELSTSESRLRLHFIANSPVTEPPITGISSQDTEDLVMSRIRSTLGKTITEGSNTYNIEDAYWQKIILPHGVKPKTAIKTDAEGYETEYYPTDPRTGAYYPSDETLKQFREYNESTQEWGEYIPIPMVRNFARIYLVNMAEDVIVFKYALAYAPTEGPVAPILNAPYYADAEGKPLSGNDGKYLTADQINTYTEGDNEFWYESFFINMQEHPLIATSTYPVAAGDHPFNYDGYSPTDQAFGSYPLDDSEMEEWFDEARNWTFDDANKKWTGVKSGESNQVVESNTKRDDPLYVYERSVPNTKQKATRVIIKALKNGETSAKYYALDIVNSAGQNVALLRNNTYTVRLTGIEVGSGQASIEDAADAASASVSGDSGTQDIPQISDGKMSIGTSYTEQLFVQPGTYDVMFRFIPDNSVTSNPEKNGDVSLQVGWKDEEHNVFYPDELGTAHSSLGASFAEASSGGTGGEGKTKYEVNIEKEGGVVVAYVRDDNQWKKASAVSGSENMEKWGKITFKTVGTESSSTLVDANGYFNESRVQTIRVTGKRTDSQTGQEYSIYRDVIIRLSPRKNMLVKCLQEYVPKAAGYEENVRVYIPIGLPVSIFPADFKIEPDKHSLTPNGDVLPVASGASIVPNATGPSFYFIKELTRSEYDGLGTETIGETTWKYFDCHFKTTMADNASTVYVQNKYFVNSSGSYSGASDDFDNYVLRYFTDYGFSDKVAEDEPVTFSFKMDTAHSSATGGLIWWDKANENAFKDTYRVLPKTVTVKLVGVHPNDSKLSRQDTWPTGVYVYNVGSSNNPSEGMASVDLSLIADADNYSVELYTGHIDPVFDLYEPVIADQDRVRVWRTATETLTIGSGNYTQTSFDYSGFSINFGQNTRGDYNYSGMWNITYYKQIGTSNQNGAGVFTVTASNGCKITGMTITYVNGYSGRSVTYDPTGNNATNTSWTASSTGEGGGETSVTVTMARGTGGNSPNRITAVQVTYGYYE